MTEHQFTTNPDTIIGHVRLSFNLFKNWSLSDVAIPVIFLTVSQFETFIITPNIAHSAFPLLLILLYSIAWTLANRYLRFLTILILNFTAMFTGFGIFIGLVTPALFLVEIVQALRLKDYRHAGKTGIAAIGAGLTILAFFHQYAFAPAVSCFEINVSFLPKYPVFMSVILGRFLGIDYSMFKWWCIAAGLLLLATMSIIFLISGVKLIKKSLPSPLNLVLSALSGFTLIFLLNAAIGRLCLGMAAAYTSRYVTLAVPGILAIYLGLLTLQNTKWRTTLIAMFILVTAISLPLKPGDVNTLDYFAKGKSAWKMCYLQIEDTEICDEKTGFWVYPPLSLSNPVQVNAFHTKLLYMKQHRLNLYIDQPQR